MARIEASKEHLQEVTIMLTLLFIIFLIGFIGKTVGLALKATWGITKFIVSVILFPITLVIMVAAGLVYVALPVLIVVGLVSILIGARE